MTEVTSMWTRGAVFSAMARCTSYPDTADLPHSLRDAVEVCQLEGGYPGELPCQEKPDAPVFYLKAAERPCKYVPGGVRVTDVMRAACWARPFTHG